MCLHSDICSIPLNLICNMATFRKNVLTFWPHLGVEDVCKDRMCACMVPLNLICNMATFQKEKMFWPLTPPQWSRVLVRTELWLYVAAFVITLIWYATWPCSEKVLFWPHPPQGRASMGKIFAIMLLQASFPLIWWTTWPYSENKFNLGFLLDPLSPTRGPDQGLRTKLLFDMFYI